MRRKADGHRFEKEFRAVAETAYYTRRMQTPSQRYAGLRQPADFFVIGKRFNYVETKETAGKSLSIKAMEQYDQICQFVELRKKYKLYRIMEYYVIVHFISEGVIKVLTAADALTLVAKRQTVKPEGEVGLTFSTLEDIIKEEIF